MLDAVVVGSGPNGLTAAITLAEAGKRVVVLEASDTPGGGARTEAGPVPGAVYDVCSSVHALAAASPALAALPLEDNGLEWLHAEVPLAHPLDGGRGAVVLRDLDATCSRLDTDGPAWRSTVGAFTHHWERALAIAFAPPLASALRPFDALWFARRALPSSTRLARRFSTDEGQALIAGLAAHAAVPLGTVATSGVALVLGAAAHVVGWPFVRGGSGSLSDAMLRHFESVGGRLETGKPVSTWDDLPPARVVVFATGPETVVAVAGDRMTRLGRAWYRRFRRGPGVFKIDVVLDGPIPWEFDGARGAGTVHVGGTLEEIAHAEDQVAAGRAPDRPFIISAQPSLADDLRAPPGRHVLWAYCHVPAGSTEDMTDRMLAQFERFAPGTTDRIVSLSSRTPGDLEAINANLVGGDVTGGALSWRGIFARPTPLRPHRAARGIYAGSSSTPPGAGAHGMCGYHAARAALRELD